MNESYASNILEQALLVHDTARPIIDYLRVRTWRKTKHSTDGSRSVISFHDTKTNELIFESEYETYGVYHSGHGVWAWAWAIPGNISANNSLMAKVLNHVISSSTVDYYAKSVLSTSRGLATDITQIDINIALGSYMLKNPYIYPLNESLTDGILTHYIILLDVDKINELEEKYSKELAIFRQ